MDHTTEPARAGIAPSVDGRTANRRAEPTQTEPPQAVLSQAEPPQAVLSQADVPADHPEPIRALLDEIGDPSQFAAVFLFVNPDADFAALMAHAGTVFAGTRLIACTTAGEITKQGYVDGRISIVGLPAALYDVETILFADLRDLVADQVSADVVRARAALTRRAGRAHEFAFLCVDGLSLAEDQLVAAIAPGLSTMPLFGGSAGDGTRFGQTLIGLDGVMHENAAVLTLVRTDCPVQVFSLDHLLPTDHQMVVTRANPAQRVVEQINAEPAALEFARILGKDPAQLDAMTFAAHPVAVRIGGRHHVRAIQRVGPNHSLVFFSAIDEGLVLRLADAQDMVTHLDGALTAMTRKLPNGAVTHPQAILACDCILRRLEAGQKQMTHGISQLLARHHVVGFATYGEQFDARHVNQTMTGVAIYAPDPAPLVSGPNGVPQR